MNHYDGDEVQDRIWKMIAEYEVEASVRFIDSWEYEIKWVVAKDHHPAYYYDIDQFESAVERWAEGSAA